MLRKPLFRGVSQKAPFWDPKVAFFDIFVHAPRRARSMHVFDFRGRSLSSFVAASCHCRGSANLPPRLSNISVVPYVRFACGGARRPDRQSDRRTYTFTPIHLFDVVLVRWFLFVGAACPCHGSTNQADGLANRAAVLYISVARSCTLRLDRRSDIAKDKLRQVSAYAFAFFWCRLRPRPLPRCKSTAGTHLVHISHILHVRTCLKCAFDAIQHTAVLLLFHVWSTLHVPICFTCAFAAIQHVASAHRSCLETTDTKRGAAVIAAGVVNNYTFAGPTATRRVKGFHIPLPYRLVD